MMNRLTSLFGLIIVTAFAAENCDKHGILIYEDLGCTPVYTNSEKCPTKYNCENFKKSTTNCYFKGKAYKHEEIIQKTGTRCSNNCFCGKNEDNTLDFRCPIRACDTGYFPFPSDCSSTYSFDSCCATGLICPPFDNTTNCNFNRESYHEGQFFYAPNTCSDCICQKGFKGKFEDPFCRRRVCGIQLERWEFEMVRNNCAPFYIGSQADNIMCCPEGWICPDGSDVIKGNPKSEDSCRFGNQTIKVGQMFERGSRYNRYGQKSDKVQCKCTIPPLITCVGTNAS